MSSGMLRNLLSTAAVLLALSGVPVMAQSIKDNEEENILIWAHAFAFQKENAITVPLPTTCNNPIDIDYLHEAPLKKRIAEYGRKRLSVMDGAELKDEIKAISTEKNHENACYEAVVIEKLEAEITFLSCCGFAE